MLPKVGVVHELQCDSRILFIKFLLFVLQFLLGIVKFLKKKRWNSRFKLVRGNPVHHENLTEIEKLSVKIFENPYIVERILGQFDKLTSLDLRLINKTFYDTCLGILRKKNRRIKIEFLQLEDALPTLDEWIVYVNGQPMKLAELSFYFSFLNKIAELKVERIIVIDVWKLRLYLRTKPLAQRFHDDVIWRLIGENRNGLKELVGLSEACNYCLECRQKSLTCREYGPINGIVLYRNSMHFEKLIVKNGSISGMANGCVRESTSKESCLKMLEEKMTMTNTTCKTLVLWISENRLMNGITVGSKSLPREALQMILKKFQVKNIEIKFVYSGRVLEANGSSESGYFTEIRFNDMFGYVKRSESSPNFDHIHVDLTRSLHCARGLKLIESRGYENMIANIRRIFSPNRLSIKFSHWSDLVATKSISEFLENMLRTSRMDNHRNLTVEVMVYSKISGDVKIENDEIVLEVPEPFEIIRPRISSYHKSLKENGSFKTEKWIGERCRFVDSEKNFTLNVDVFVTEEDINKAVSEHFQTIMLMRMFRLDF